MACKEDLWQLYPQQHRSAMEHVEFGYGSISNTQNSSFQQARIDSIKFTKFSAMWGLDVSSNSAMTAGSASVWWFDIKTILWPCHHEKTFCKQSMYWLLFNPEKNKQFR
jgi:hypothetical protein